MAFGSARRGGPEPLHDGVSEVGPDAARLTDVVTRLRRALRSSVRTDAAWEWLPMAQVELLQTVAERQPCRVGDLADRLHLAPSTISGLVSQLLASGLIERRTDRHDRRAAVLRLSRLGDDQLAGWTRVHEARIRAALGRLDATDRLTIDTAIPALARLASRLDEPPGPP